jgi:hypothetical protein
MASDADVSVAKLVWSQRETLASSLVLITLVAHHVSTLYRPVIVCFTELALDDSFCVIVRTEAWARLNINSMSTSLARSQSPIGFPSNLMFCLHFLAWTCDMLSNSLGVTHFPFPHKENEYWNILKAKKKPDEIWLHQLDKITPAFWHLINVYSPQRAFTYMHKSSLKSHLFYIHHSLVWQYRN